MTVSYLHRGVPAGVPAPFALPAAFAAFLAVGTVAAALHGRMAAFAVLVACAVVAGVVVFAAAPAAALPVAGIGWLTVTGFSRPPYARLHLTGSISARAGIVIGASALAGVVLGAVFRWYLGRRTLVSMSARTSRRVSAPRPADAVSAAEEDGGRGIDVRRQLAGVLAGAILLPLITVALTSGRQHLNLADDLLVYLVAVVAITLVGGFWPAVLAAIAASLLLNWYFTAPLHTFTIQQPDELLALLLFVTVAVSVSSVVHLAARRAVQSAHSKAEATALLELAQTVLSGSDTPKA